MTKEVALEMFKMHLQVLQDGDLHYQFEWHKTNQMQMYEIAIECIEECIGKEK